jgi:hypothetical protein
LTPGINEKRKVKKLFGQRVEGGGGTKNLGGGGVPGPAAKVAIQARQ